VRHRTLRPCDSRFTLKRSYGFRTENIAFNHALGKLPDPVSPHSFFEQAQLHSVAGHGPHRMGREKLQSNDEEVEHRDAFCRRDYGKNWKFPVSQHPQKRTPPDVSGEGF
jgi:hypothetical protein